MDQLREVYAHVDETELMKCINTYARYNEGRTGRN
jgi:hypothetical protein